MGKPGKAFKAGQPGKAGKAGQPGKKPTVDFKKVKRKVGKKLPPPKNDTQTEAKAKRIALPNQRVGEHNAKGVNSPFCAKFRCNNCEWSRYEKRKIVSMAPQMYGRLHGASNVWARRSANAAGDSHSHLVMVE
jgi:hypothetical protein